MTGRPTHGPLPEGAPELAPAAEAVLDPARHQEVLTAHAERLVVSGADRVGRGVVVKVDRDAVRHRREADVLRRLRAAEVAVPEVVSSGRDDGTGAWVLVLEHVDGRPLDADDGPEEWAAVGAQLAHLHGAVPSPDGPPFWGHTDAGFAQHLRTWCALEQRTGVEDGWLRSDQAERLGVLVEEAAARADDVPGVLLHGDCAPWHWLLTPLAPPRPVDLGDAGVGDPAFDLMVLTLEAPDRLAPALEGYGADAALRTHVDAVLPGYRALRLAGQVAWLRSHGFDPGPSQAGLDDALG